MAKTDGYITKAGSDDWKYSNVGGGQGDIGSPTDTGIYARIEVGAQPGTRVNGVGGVSEGVIVSFVDPAGLLSQLPSSDDSRPNIKWAGVNPMSLQEALIVWNTDVVLLNKNKVKQQGEPAEIVAMVGRLMIVKLPNPVPIDGSENFQIVIESGAVGFYGDGETDQDIASQQADEEQTDEEGNLLEEEEEEEEEESTCTTGFGDLTSGTGNQVYQLVFSTMCNPAAQCGEFEGNIEQFVVNNGMSFTVACTHTFSLEALTSRCGDSSMVWEASMEIFGGTLPGEVFPLDQLVTVLPGSIGETNFPDGYPASLKANVACATDGCPDGDVYIFGRFGPPVEESGTWKSEEPGYEGQAVLWDCGEIHADIVDCYVPEDIIKPVQRTIPVSFYDDWYLTTTKLTVPSTITTTNLILPTDIVTSPITYVETIITSSIIVPTGAGALVTEVGATPLHLVTDVPTDSGSFLSGAGATGVTAVGSKPINIITSIPTTALTIVSNVESHVGDFVSVGVGQNPGWVDEDNPYEGVELFNWVSDISTTSLMMVEEDVTAVTTFGQVQAPLLAYNLHKTVTVTNIATEVIHALDGPELSLVSTVSAGEVIIPTAILTGLVVVPTGAGAVVTEILTATIDKIDSIGTTEIDYLTSVAGQLVANVATVAATVQSSTGQNEVSYVTDAISSIQLATVSIDALGTPLMGSPAVAAAAQPGQLLQSPISTESITGIQGVGLAPLATYLTAAAAVTVVTAYSTVAIVYCSDGAVVTATVMADPQTSVLSGLGAVLPTSITTADPVVVVASPILVDVATTALSYVTSVPVIPQVVIEGITPVAAELATAQIPLFGEQEVVIPTFDVVELGTATQALVSAITTSPQVVPTSVGTSDLATTAIVMATELQTVPVNLVTSIVLAPVTRTAITHVTSSQTTLVTDWPLNLLELVPYNLVSKVYSASTIIDAAVSPITDVIEFLPTAINRLTPQVGPAVTSVQDFKYYPAVAKTGVGETPNVVTSVGTSSIVGQDITFIKGEIASTDISVVTTVGTVEAGTVSAVIISSISTVSTDIVNTILTTSAYVTLNSGEIILDVIIEGEEGDIQLLTSTDRSNCDVKHKILMHDGALSATTISKTEDGSCCSEGTCELGSDILQEESDCTSFLLLRAHYVDEHDAPTRDSCPCYDCSEEQCDDPDSNRLEPAPTSGTPQPCTIRVRRLNRRWCHSRSVGG